MNLILLTRSTTPIIGWIADLLGLIMDAIFYVINLIGLPYVGLAIILFTVVVNLLMLPLTIRQQKFSKLSAKMNPELQAIKDKYKNRKDNDSLMAQQQEVQAVYAKYGVSAGGSCLQLLIQMPILFALYRVIQSMPAYVTKIRETFEVLANKIILDDHVPFLTNSGIQTIQNTVNTYGDSIKNGNLTNGVIDVLNKLSSEDLSIVASNCGLSQLTYDGQLILSNDTTRGLIDTYNNFLGLNMGDSPMYQIQNAATIGIIIGALLIPILSAVTQWINVKLMPQAAAANGDPATSNMASSMKMMNFVMPLLSAWLCFSLPAGLGLYWVAGSVVRSIQQVIINRRFDKMDFDELLKQNAAKNAKKMEKLKQRQEMINAYASMNTKNIQRRANSYNNPADDTAGSESSESSSGNSGAVNAKPNSITAKANLVRQYNERNNNK